MAKQNGVLVREKCLRMPKIPRDLIADMIADSDVDVCCN